MPLPTRRRSWPTVTFAMIFAKGTEPISRAAQSRQTSEVARRSFTSAFIVGSAHVLRHRPGLAGQLVPGRGQILGSTGCAQIAEPRKLPQ